MSWCTHLFSEWGINRVQWRHLASNNRCKRMEIRVSLEQTLWERSILSLPVLYRPCSTFYRSPFSQSQTILAVICTVLGVRVDFHRILIQYDVLWRLWKLTNDSTRIQTCSSFEWTWNSIRRACGQSLPLLSSRAVFSSSLHIHPSYDAWFCLPVLNFFVLYGVQLHCWI